MLGLYLASLGFGASLILVSLLFGGGDKEFDKDFDKDLELDGDADIDGAAEGQVGASTEAAGPWLPLLSMRFWTFALATFGLTGTLLTLLSVPALITGVMAGVVGIGLGLGAARFFHALKKDSVTAEVSLSRFAGEEARVLLAVRPGGTGKIVLQTATGRVEMPATTRDSEALDIGATVIIASVRDGVADVSDLRARKRRNARASQTVGRTEGT